MDHDYVLSAAQIAKAGGTKHFQLMSSYGANHNSSALYTRTKVSVVFYFVCVCFLLFFFFSTQFYVPFKIISAYVRLANQ